MRRFFSSISFWSSSIFFVIFGQLSFEVFHHVFQGGFQLLIACVRRAQLFAQVRNEFAIEFHLVFDEGHVFGNGLLVGFFAGGGLHGHDVFGFVDGLEAFLDFLHGAHQVVRFGFWPDSERFRASR